jgi:hypothetical protein
MMPAACFGCRRAGVAFRGGWWFGVGDGVCGDPFPSDCAPERAVQDEVDLPDGRRGKWLARVWSAAIVGLVLTGCPVVDLAFGLLAMLAAPAEFGVQGVHYTGVEGADLLLAEEWADVFLGVAPVHVQGVELQVFRRGSDRVVG